MTEDAIPIQTALISLARAADSLKNNDPKRPFATSSTGELLCIPYLDTDTKRDTILADAELANRGYPEWLTWLLRKLCLVGLWHQLFVWEDVHLDLSDVAAGYGVMLLLLGIAAVILGNFAIPQLAVAGLVAAPLGLLLLALAVLGWKRYRRRMAAWIAEHERSGELNPAKK